MQYKKYFYSAFIALWVPLVLSPYSFAEPSAVPTLAGILTELNHYPSATQKEALVAISQNEAQSKVTRTIARAIHNIEHKAKPDDVAALTEIQKDNTATDAEKKLATIVVALNHSVSAETKKALETLSK